MRRTHIGVIMLAASVVGGWALAQNAGPDDRAGWTGLTEPEEIIEARRVLMIDMERQMAPIDAFTAGEPADLAGLRARGLTIEAMLLAFPHLFPPTTNLFDPDVLERPTITLPALWEDFDAFLALAEAGETAAAAVAAADDAEALRAAGLRLRATCDTCHARFSQPYTPPEVRQEDLEFDFDSVLP